jgi:hypothetical protein
MSFFARQLAIAVPCPPLLGCPLETEGGVVDKARLGELSGVWLHGNSPAAKFHTLKNFEVHDGFSCAFAQCVLNANFRQYATVGRLHN